jgi:DNA-binding NtrC family response regulator
MSSIVLLVVEDVFFLQNLSGNLKRLKASIVTAGNKHEALEVCSNQDVDLALLDIRKQGEDAMQILTSLKKRQPETEVILLSDQENIALAMEGMQQGATDDIIVPFDVDFFLKKIKSALKRRKARRRYARKSNLLNVFEDAMAAAAYAQAGEFETAQEIYMNGCRTNGKRSEPDAKIPPRGGNF